MGVYMQDAGVAHRCVGTRIRPTAEESFRALRTDADAARRRAATLELISDKATALSNAARGELATKVRYFGGKSTNVPRGQMGTKPAKVAHRLVRLGATFPVVERTPCLS